MVRQPKRLALLAYLAAASPHRFHRRDTLLALFWPELDDARARGALRRALYFLRGALGSEAIVGRGDDVATDQERLWCDATAFRDALGHRRPGEAIDLYRGNLLEGFFVASAPEFERWLDDERGELRALAAAAAWGLSEQADAAGDRRAAVRWGRRAAGLTPDDEGAVRRLVGLLDRVGDPAAAIQTYEAFARRLADEYGIEPSPESRTLVEAVRSRRAVPEAADTETAETPPALLRNLIAVLPFSVRGNEAFRYLREGMVDLLSAKLDRAGDVGTVDPRALLRYVQSLGVAEIDPHLARTVAAHFSAGFFVMGSIVEAGGHLHLGATIFQTDGRQEIRADVDAEGEAGIIPAVDALARRLIAARPVSLGSLLARLAAVATDSLPAIKAYLVGERAFRAGNYGEAVVAYETAVGEDPSFALGHYRLAATYIASGMPEAAARASALASKHRGRLNAHIQLLLEAQAAWLDGDASGAEARYTRLVASSPDHVEAWFLLGDLNFRYNPFRGRSITDSRPPLERALALDPRHIGALSGLIKLAALEGRQDELDRLVLRLIEAHGTGDRTLAARAVHAFAAGRPEPRRRVADELRSAAVVTAAHTVADVALYSHDLDGAQLLARALAADTPSPGYRAQLRLVAAHLARSRGDLDGARQHLEAVEAMDRAAAIVHRAYFAVLPFDDIPAPEIEGARNALSAWEPSRQRPSLDRPVSLAGHEGLHVRLRSYLQGMVAARVGAYEAALGYADACEASGSSGREFAGTLARGVRAHVAALRGEPERALAIIESLSPRFRFHLAAGSPFHALTLERWLCADVLVRLGRCEEAVGWLEGLGQLSPYGIVLREPAKRRMLEIQGGEVPPGAF